MADKPINTPEAKQALQRLIDSLVPIKVAMKTPEAIPKPIISVAGIQVPLEPQERKLLAVRVWQEITYLVRPKVGDNVAEIVVDPMNRIAKVGEGKVEAKYVREVRDATAEDLEAATPTKALVI